MPFRAVFVHCKELNKGFVTCLLRDDRLTKLYEQVEDVILKDCPYELVSLELSESIQFDNWTLPRFLRMKDLVLDDPLYAKAIVQRKETGSSVPPWKQYLKEASSASKKRVQKDKTPLSKLQRMKRSKNSLTPKLSTPDHPNNLSSPSKSKQLGPKRKLSPQKEV